MMKFLFLDGSSSGYCMLIEEAGIKELDKSKKVIKIKKKWLKLQHLRGKELH